MKLLEAWNCDEARAYKLFQQLPSNENGFENAAAGMTPSEFHVYVQGLRDEEDERRLRPGRVPQTKYVLVDDAGTYVGIFNLRHRLNEHLRQGAGHIGYGIAPAFRGRGYATEGLRLVLERARALGIAEAYLSVHKDNPASLKVQQHLGARIDHEDDGEYYTRIALG